MSKGKIDSSSSKAYVDEKNPDINNMIFDSKRLDSPNETNKRKKPHFYARYIQNKKGLVSLTRAPEAVFFPEAKKLFKKLINQYEEVNITKLHDLSKKMIMCQMLEEIEATNSIVTLKDEAKQFLPYRFQFSNIVKLYLFKVFYPQVFDYELLNNDGNEEIKFHSHYIDNNFTDIFRKIETLTYTIIYDAILIAIEDFLSRQVCSLNRYAATINPTDSISDMTEYLETEVSSASDPRINLVKLLIPSVVFLAKYHKNLYKNQDSSEKRIITVLNYQGLYEGKRGFDSRNALIDTYKECGKILEKISDPTIKLLNLYYINRRTHFFDFVIMSKNTEFSPYALNGIISKYHIDTMIIDNYKKIKNPKSDNLQVSLVHNNPNCIISNISSRDYEIVDFLITRTAKTISEYYLKEKGTDVPPQRYQELIAMLSKDGYIETMSKIIRHKRIRYVDKVDYELVMNFKSDEMKG